MCHTILWRIDNICLWIDAWLCCMELISYFHLSYWSLTKCNFTTFALFWLRKCGSISFILLYFIYLGELCTIKNDHHHSPSDIYLSHVVCSKLKIYLSLIYLSCYLTKEKIYLSLFVRYLNHLNFKYNLSQYMNQMCHYLVEKNWRIFLLFKNSA